MNAILNTLLEITVFSAVLYGAILLFQKFFRKYISAVMNYALYALLILRLIIPVTVDSGLHFFIIPDEPKQAAYTAVSDNYVPSQGYSLMSQPTTDNTSSETSINSETNDTALSIQNQIKPWGIKWQTALVFIWGAGVFFSIGFVAVFWRRLRQKIKRCGTAAPEYVLKLVNKCKSEMGIKAGICVSVQGWLKSPALSASLKPMLLIPKHMLHTMDLKQLELGIRHELTHYLRRDHLINLLLVALRCVYWFNPVLYFASRSMQTDMETACDVQITSRLKDTERMRYIRTMIDLGGSGNIQYVLGMGMSKGGKEMEKRVRGIFMRKKTRLPVKMAAALLAGLLLFACFTTACQPSPEKPAVINKNGGELEDIIQSAPVPSEQIVSENQWTETYTFKNLVCDINTGITIPKTNEFPVYKVKKGRFGPDFVDKLIKYFTVGATGVRKTSPTKEELEQQLIQVKRGQYVADDSGGRWEAYDGQEQDIANLEEQIKNAIPESFENVSNKVAVLPADNTYLLADGSKVYIQAGNNSIEFSADKYAGIMTESIITKGGARPGEPAGTTLQNVKISEEDARAKVNSFMTDLGIENLGIAKIEKARMSSEYTPDSEGWIVTAARNDGNSVPVDLMSVQGSGLLDFGSEDYAERWQPETMALFVDETGIRYLSWVSPLEVVEEMNENVMLQQFEDIKERIRKNIEFGYSQSVKNGIVQGNHHLMINKIILTNVLVPIKDELDYQMLVPAWLVYFNDATEDNDMTYVFAVNAIDGSSIDFTLRQLAPVINP